MKNAVVILMALGLSGPWMGHDSDLVARFEGGIGVIPVSRGALPQNADGTFQNVVANVVRGVQPGAGPWRIADLRAEVYAGGRIKVRGRGLLLASGNAIGTNANQRVFATLSCATTGSVVEHSTAAAGVALDQNGDFRIDDVLQDGPSECASPVLLIRNTGGVWFAAGIPVSGDN